MGWMDVRGIMHSSTLYKWKPAFVHPRLFSSVRGMDGWMDGWMSEGMVMHIYYYETKWNNNFLRLDKQNVPIR
jgi:hypothetical protein